MAEYQGRQEKRRSRDFEQAQLEAQEASSMKQQCGDDRPAFTKRRPQGLTLHHLHQDIVKLSELIIFFGVRIMGAISEFATKQNAHNDRHDKSIEGLQADSTTLKDMIAKLQSTQGQITAEDQALLDGIETRAAAISDKLEALDALTPPTPPTA